MIDDDGGRHLSSAHDAGAAARQRWWRRAMLGGALLAVALLGGAALHFVAQAGEGAGDCQNCHPDVYNDIATMPYVHRPVLEHKCALCHVEGGGAQPFDKVAADKALKETQWVAKNLGKGREHWLKLSQNLAGQSVVIRTESEDGRVQQSTERVPELPNLPDVGDERAGLVIETPEVVSVQRGVMLSATIVWKTNKVSDSAVYYGENSLNASSPVDGRLSRQHEIVLTGLTAGKNYRFVAISTDTAGNSVRSQEMVFSTARPFSREAAAPAGTTKGGARPIGVQKTFYRGRGQVLLEVIASEPVSIMVGTSAQPMESAAIPRREARSRGRLPARHPALVDRYALTVTVCLSCHPATKGVVSHPVNVYPKSGMVIPSDYRTLPDGRISCMSCHVAHAGHYQYRIPKPSKKALCTGCHRNFR